MKPTTRQLFTAIRNKRSELANTPFGYRDTDASIDPQDGGMSRFVRTRGKRRGLDKLSRTHSGPDSGVAASPYNHMVRGGGDHEGGEDYRNPIVRRGEGDYFKSNDKGENDLYKSNRNRKYDRNEFNDDGDIDDFDAEAGWEFMRQLDAEAGEDTGGSLEDRKRSLSVKAKELSFLAQQIAKDRGIETGEAETPSRYDGVVRSVKGAYLVSKIQQPDETYTEVWIFNVGGKNHDDEANIRKGIVAGTDIDPTKNFSEDGTQEAYLTTLGNVQYMTLTGLPD